MRGTSMRHELLLFMQEDCCELQSTLHSLFALSCVLHVAQMGQNRLQLLPAAAYTCQIMQRSTTAVRFVYVFACRRKELLALREVRQKELDAGKLPDFLGSTKAVGEDDSGMQSILLDGCCWPPCIMNVDQLACLLMSSAVLLCIGARGGQLAGSQACTWPCGSPCGNNRSSFPKQDGDQCKQLWCYAIHGRL